MEKDYKLWEPLKNYLHNSNAPRVFFHEREIWLCHLGENIGFEQGGKAFQFLRPVIVLQKFNNQIFGEFL